MKFAISVCWVLLLTTVIVNPQTSPSPNGGAQPFDRLVDEYFDFYFHFHPTSGTQAGLHQYDDQLEDFSPASVKDEVTGLKRWLEQFEGIAEPSLPQQAQGDLDFIKGHTHARLLELEEIQMWRKDPDVYTSSVSSAVFVVMRRNFAPQADRLRSVIARERKFSQVFEEARGNLGRPPRVYTEVALQQLPGTILFFQNDVASAFSEVKDRKLLDEFRTTNQLAVRALQDYETYLRKDVLPKSDGDFRLGADKFHRKLLYEDLVDLPLDQILKIGYADLHRNQEQLRLVSERVAPHHSVTEALAEIQNDHPTPEQLLQSFRDVLEGLRSFIEQKHIATIPSEILPIVEETPPFERALTTAAMDTPGAYEHKATEALFDVTLPDTGWDAKQREEWMQGFNREAIRNTAVHEAYPGHYLQFLWQGTAPSKTRKLLYCSSNVEGWAHYSEQMMLDEGYGNGDPKLRMAQLVDALLRDARLIVGIEMHTKTMTLDQAKDFFVREAFVVPPMANSEAERGTSDPTYLVYTLGKLQILKLREDYRKEKGDQFSLLQFHDEFLKQGGMPLTIIRKAMLKDAAPTP